MSFKPKFFKAPSLLSGYSKDSPILLGLSGGADSSLLLHLLCDYARDTGAKIFAAHVNHGIRTKDYCNESDRDEEFCRELCKNLGVDLFVNKLDIPKMAATSGRGIEAEAREARYDFFAKVMQENNIKILATAHNASDNIETQIYNLARGCGIDGLAGIPESRPIDLVEGGIVIRPILSAKKSEIIEYCEKNAVPFVNDSTNFEDEYTRNAIRHRVIPVLEDLFPHLTRSSQRLSALATEDADFILSCAKEIVSECQDKISIEKLSKLHPSVAKRVIKLMFKQVSDATLGYVHILSVLSLVDADKNGAAISLPDKMRAVVVDGYLSFDSEDSDATMLSSYSIDITRELNIIEGTPFAVLISDEAPKANIDGYSLYASAKIKADSATALYVKNRQSGMTITDGGINKKIKKMMCDKKVPLYDRDTLPLVCSGEEIIYTPLCAVCDNAKPHKQDKTVHIGIYQKIGG